jgi:hypothetical protein
LKSLTLAKQNLGTLSRKPHDTITSKNEYKMESILAIMIFGEINYGVAREAFR